jgi:hypothetical protein
MTSGNETFAQHGRPPGSGWVLESGGIMTSHLVSFCTGAVCSAGFGQSPGTFTPAGNMTIPRITHTATLLTTERS